MVGAPSARRSSPMIIKRGWHFAKEVDELCNTLLIYAWTRGRGTMMNDRVSSPIEPAAKSTRRLRCCRSSSCLFIFYYSLNKYDLPKGEQPNVHCNGCIHAVCTRFVLPVYAPCSSTTSCAPDSCRTAHPWLLRHTLLVVFPRCRFVWPFMIFVWRPRPV